MKWVSLQMVSLGSLLIFSHRASCAGGSRCVREDQLWRRVDKFLRSYWDRLNVSRNLLTWNTTTCAQVARELRGELSNRSVSPWRYSLDKDMSRFPQEIAVAKCLCQGCIINQHEDLNYNSVPVFAPLKVLRKTRCQDDPSKYVVTKAFIKVPVACTCAVPKYAE